MKNGGKIGRRRRQRGQAMIETGLMLVIVVTAIFWVFELCWLMYTYTVIADAANEGVRYAIVQPGGDPTGTTSRVKAVAGTSMHNVSSISVLVTFQDSPPTSCTDTPQTTNTAPPHKVMVMVCYQYVPFLPQFMGSPSLRTYAEGTMVRGG